MADREHHDPAERGQEDQSQDREGAPSSALGQLAGRFGAAGVHRALQRRAARGRADDSSPATHEQAQAGLSGAPSPLPHLDRIQESFGRHDASKIQAHVGGVAAEASEAMGARAYATGDSVAFREAPGLHTAAHEAAHVIQQRGGVQLKAGVGQEGDAYEHHADQVADLVVQGQSAESALDQMSGGAGGGPAVQHEKDDQSESEGGEEAPPEEKKEKKGGASGGVSVQHPHTLPLEEAKKRAEGLFEWFSEKYGAESRWDSDNQADIRAASGALKGMSGKIICGQNEFVVELGLPMMLRPLKGKLEQEVRSQLEKATAESETEAPKGGETQGPKEGETEGAKE
jgi:putative polyhydroxyalkanoate system protein